MTPWVRAVLLRRKSSECEALDRWRIATMTAAPGRPDYGAWGMNHRRPSRYIETINPDAKRFVPACSACGRRGYAPQGDEPDFASDMVRAAVRQALRRRYEPLPLDAIGRCPVCVAAGRPDAEPGPAHG